ncbi:MAG: twin-arginine translocation signal domain-containing protein, partial [Methylovirgula sp.]
MTHSNGRSGSGFAQISRRDFLNGCLIASGGLAFGQRALFPAVAAETGAAACNDIAGNDPRVLRSGNLPSAFNVAHWLRDQRLSFEPNRVT